MSGKITNLTAEQEAKFPEYVKTWTDIGLQTGPINREKNNAAIKAMYKLANLEEPEIIYADCPISGGKMASALMEGLELTEENLKKVKPSTNWLWGNMWAGYGAWGSFFKNECGVDVNEDCLEFIKEGHYIWPLEGICVASERPIKIKRDNNGQSHCEDGPAIEYPSGWGIYCWHGTNNIPKHWIEGTLTAKEALSEQNMERRLAACEILGWHNIIRELNAKVLDKHPDPEIGELLEIDMPDVGKMRLLRVMCGTGREFALLCQSANTALEAQAIIHSHTLDTFEPPAFRS